LQYSFRGLDGRNMDRNSDAANLEWERLPQPIKKKEKRNLFANLLQSQNRVGLLGRIMKLGWLEPSIT
jgi:hypothetical protein